MKCDLEFHAVERLSAESHPSLNHIHRPIMFDQNPVQGQTNHLANSTIIAALLLSGAIVAYGFRSPQVDEAATETQPITLAKRPQSEPTSTTEPVKRPRVRRTRLSATTLRLRQAASKASETQSRDGEVLSIESTDSPNTAPTDDEAAKDESLTPVEESLALNVQSNDQPSDQPLEFPELDAPEAVAAEAIRSTGSVAPDGVDILPHESSEFDPATGDTVLTDDDSTASVAVVDLHTPSAADAPSLPAADEMVASVDKPESAEPLPAPEVSPTGLRLRNPSDSGYTAIVMISNRWISIAPGSDHAVEGIGPWQIRFHRASRYATPIRLSAGAYDLIRTNQGWVAKANAEAVTVED
ncbi:MAG: hypothetical protein AAGA03_05670 [Planctomycetota bacterium]